MGNKFWKYFEHIPLSLDEEDEIKAMGNTLNQLRSITQHRALTKEEAKREKTIMANLNERIHFKLPKAKKR